MAAYIWPPRPRGKHRTERNPRSPWQVGSQYWRCIGL